MSLIDFGFYVHRLRELRGISGYEISLRIGKTTSYIYKVENNLISVGTKVVYDLADALEVDVRELFKPVDGK